MEESIKQQYYKLFTQELLDYDGNAQKFADAILSFFDRSDSEGQNELRVMPNEVLAGDTRQLAINIIELLKGETPEQRVNWSNTKICLEELALKVLELTNK